MARLPLKTKQILTALAAQGWFTHTAQFDATTGETIDSRRFLNALTRIRIPIKVFEAIVRRDGSKYSVRFLIVPTNLTNFQPGVVELRELRKIRRKVRFRVEVGGGR